MMSQDNRLMPLTPEPLDRPLRDLTQPAPVAAAATEPAHLREYLAVVLKRKWLILSLMVVVTSLVAIQMYRLPSVYEAQTTIQIEQKNKSVLETGKSGLIIRGGNDPNYWNTQLKLLENPLLARQVVLRLDLQNNPAFLGGQSRPSLLTSLRRIVSRDQKKDQSQADDAGVPIANDADIIPEALTPEQVQKLEPYEDVLRASLLVEPIEKTNLVVIRFKHTDPQIAMNVANGLAQTFIVNDLMRETTGSEQARETLGKQIVDLQERVRKNEAAKIAYMGRSDLPFGDKPGQDFIGLRLGTYSSQLQAAEAERKNLEAAYNEAATAQQNGDIMSVPQVLDDKNVQRMREKIENLQTQRAALVVKYTPEWPEVKKIDRQIETLEKEIEKTPREIITSLKRRYDSALAKESKLRSAYEAERGRANSQSRAAMGLTDLLKEIETDRQNLQTYQQRLRELQVTSQDRGANVSVATPARQPREPIGPPRLRNILIALLLSLGAGIGLAFLLDYLDDTLKSVEDVDRHLHLPTLALIPAPRAERSLLRGRVAVEPADGSTALALIEDVRSPVAEAYRHLRTSLLLSSAGQPPKTVLVTSSQPSEGKTTTAVNIAMMLAQTGAEVLLLDCDLRRPRIHSHFGMPNARGVTNYLSGEAQLGDLVQTSDRLPKNLKVITSGPVPPNAAELLGSDEMRRLLYVLSESYTHIIIDSPPAISFTDAAILSTLVDGVMLVVHGGRSSRAVVRRAKQQLLDVGAHIFGIVLNNVKLESSDYYYYSGYYANYYATEGGDDDGGAAAAAAAGAGREGGAR